MKITKKVLATITSAALFFSLCMPITSMAEETPTLTYTFTEGTSAGIADGTITLSGLADIKDTITKVNMYWGSDASTPLENYANIRNYTVAGLSSISNYNKTKLEYTDNSLVYEIKGSRYIPVGANFVIADIITSDGTTQTTQTVSVEIQADKKTVEEEPLYTMVWISDTHATYTSYLSDSNLNKAFSDIQEIATIDGDKFKGVVVNGDMANSAWDYEYQIMEDLIDKYPTNKPVYYNTGNHDTESSLNGGRTSVCADAMDTRFTKLKSQFGLEFDRRDDWSYDTYIEGHHYIFLSLPYYSSYTLSDAQAKWLEEKICEDEKSGTPTFIFCHVPYPNTVAKTTNNGFYETETTKRFADVIERHPSAVVVTSHIHLEFDADQLTAAVNDVIDGYSTPISYVDTSSCYNTYVAGVSDKVSHAYGRYAEIYSDKVIVRARDFKNKKWIPRSEYVIPVNVSNAFIGDVTIEGWTQNSLEAGAALSAKLNGNAIDTAAYTYTWYIDGAEVGTANTDYTVETANKDVAVKVVNNETGAFAYAITDYREAQTSSDDEEEEFVFDGSASVKYYNNIVNVSGSVDSSYAGTKATLILILQSSYTDLSTAEYINECKIAADGSYQFKFKSDAVNTSDEDYVFIVKTEQDGITKNRVLARNDEELVTLSGVYDVSTGVTASIKNNFLDEKNTYVIIASYDENKAVKEVKYVPFNMAFGENGEIQSTALTVTDPGTQIKVFLWENFTTLKPIATEFLIDEIPEPETEETAGVSEE